MATADNYAFVGAVSEAQTNYPLQDAIVTKVTTDYDPAGDQNKLQLSKGDVVFVLDRHESGWWGGHKAEDDLTAWFPASHVQVIAGQEMDDALQQQLAFETPCKCVSTNPLQTRDHRAVASPLRQSLASQHATELAEAKVAADEARKELDQERNNFDRKRRSWSQERMSFLEQVSSFEQEKSAWADDRRAWKEQADIFDQDRRAWLEERRMLQDKNQDLQRQLNLSSDRISNLEALMSCTPAMTHRVIEPSSGQRTMVVPPSPRCSSPPRSLRAASPVQPAKSSPARNDHYSSQEPLTARGFTYSSSAPRIMAPLVDPVVSGNNVSYPSPARRPASTQAAAQGMPTATPAATSQCVIGSQTPRAKSPPLATVGALAAVQRPPSPRPWAFAQVTAPPAPSSSGAMSSGRESPARAAPPRSGASTPPVRALVSAFEQNSATRIGFGRGGQNSVPTPAPFGPFGPAPSFPPRSVDASPARQHPGGMAPLVRCNSAGRAGSFELRPPSNTSAVIRQHSRGAVASAPVPAAALGGQASAVRDRIRQFNGSR